MSNAPFPDRRESEEGTSRTTGALRHDRNRGSGRLPRRLHRRHRRHPRQPRWHRRRTPLRVDPQPGELARTPGHDRRRGEPGLRADARVVRRDRCGGDGPQMYDTGADFWGDNPPFRTPVFVLTHRPHPTLVKQGGTTFTFVTDGIHSALAQARSAAGRRNVDIAGGARTVRQYLREGLIDELQLHVVPALLGDGLRLFEGVGAGRLEQVRVVDTPLATHLKYRVGK